MGDIYIYTPADSTSGGPESLHQLAHELNSNGFTCYTVYYGRKKKIPKQLKKYKIIKKNKIKDETDNIIICPESATEKIMTVKRAKRVIWWLSLDFYHLFDYKEKAARWAKKTKVPDKFYESLLRILKKQTFHFDETVESVYHMYNSEYVREFLKEKNISEKHMFYLCGPINTKYVDNKLSINIKEDIVSYNPKKGHDFTKKIIDSFKDSDVTFLPIENMNQQEVYEALRKSKIYMDFGEFPGPERLPREAVLLYCNIITGTEGASNNAVDVPINQTYKFDKKEENIMLINKKIHSMINNYSKDITDFNYYRQKVNTQRLDFRSTAAYNIKNISQY